MAAVIDDVDAGGDRLVVTCRGELDLHSAPDLRERMLAAIEAGKTRLVIDLTEVSFIDSTVMTVLLQRRKELAARNGTLALVGLGDDLRTIFDIAGLDRAIPEYASIDAAFGAAPNP